MKNVRTPRTLSECSFETGYPSASARRASITERIGDVMLATIIGICLAAALVNWWAS